VEVEAEQVDENPLEMTPTITGKKRTSWVWNELDLVRNAKRLFVSLQIIYESLK